MRKLEAVYEGGVLRPTEKLLLEEHQLVTLIVVDEDTDEDEIQFEPPQCFESFANHAIGGKRFGALCRSFPGHWTRTSLLNGTNVRCLGTS